jgi:hypothetical protein
MIGWLSEDDHERLWRLCDGLVTGNGARAAMLCDAGTGTLLVSVGEAGGEGKISGVDSLGPGERLVRGEAGHVYGVDVPGGAMLAVLHDEGTLHHVRTAAAVVVVEAAQLLREAAERPAPPPAPGPEHAHAHGEHFHGGPAETQAPAAQEPAPQRPRARKPPSRKPPVRRPAPKARAARKAAPKQSASKKPASRKPAAKKAASKKASRKLRKPSKKRAPRSIRRGKG